MASLSSLAPTGPSASLALLRKFNLLLSINDLVSTMSFALCLSFRPELNSNARMSKTTIAPYESGPRERIGPPFLHLERIWGVNHGRNQPLGPPVVRYIVCLNLVTMSPQKCVKQDEAQVVIIAHLQSAVQYHLGC